MDWEAMEYLDLHAGSWETSVVAAYFPDQVDEKVARTLEPTKVTMKEVGEWVTNAKKITPLGYMGDPAKIDVSMGKKDLKDNCRMMAEAIANYMGKNK